MLESDILELQVNCTHIKDSEHKNKNAETEEANESETVAKTVLREDGVGIKIDTVG